MKTPAAISRPSFSLIEVVLALGVVAFAIVAILGMVPAGLSASHGAQDETRAAQIAQAILSSLASQSQTQFTNVQLALNDKSSTSLDLTAAPTTTTVYADKDGKLASTPAGAIYAVAIMTDNAPVGFDPQYANKVTVSVAWPATAAAANQAKRNFVRIVSKY